MNLPPDFAREPFVPPPNPVMAFAPQLIRICLRYVAGFLVAKGILDAGAGDALASDATLIDAGVAIVGVVIGGATEWWFSRAVKTAAK